MENIQTKVPNNRRGKIFVVILLVVILVLSIHIYRENNLKKDMIRRKAFLIAILRETKVKSGKLSLQIEGQKKDLAAKQKVIQEVQSKLVETTRSFQQQADRLKALQESATKSKQSLDALQKLYDDASSTIKAVDDKLEKTIESCQDINNKNEGLNKDIKEKEYALEKCSQEKDTLSKENEDMENHKKQMALSQQRQSTDTGLQSSKFVNPPRDNIYNQQQPLKSSPVNIRQSNLPPSNTDVTQTQTGYPKQSDIAVHSDQIPAENQITTENQITRDKTTEPGSQTLLHSNPDSAATRK